MRHRNSKDRLLLAVAWAASTYVLAVSPSFTFASTLAGLSRRIASSATRHESRLMRSATDSRVAGMQDMMAALEDSLDNQDQKAPAVKPKFELKGPLAPPKAPATYEAKMKLRLRQTPSRLSDLLPVEIEKGERFRALEFRKDEDDPQVTWFRTNVATGGWVMDTGIAGKLGGKKVLKRVAGCVEDVKGVTIHMVSQVEEVQPEVLEPGAAKPGSKYTPSTSNAEPAMGEDGVPPEVAALFSNPKIVALLNNNGIGVDDIRKNPELMEAMRRKFYGDEVVS